MENLPALLFLAGDMPVCEHIHYEHAQKQNTGSFNSEKDGSSMKENLEGKHSVVKLNDLCLLHNTEALLMLKPGLLQCINIGAEQPTFTCVNLTIKQLISLDLLEAYSFPGYQSLQNLNFTLNMQMNMKEKLD